MTATTDKSKEATIDSEYGPLIITCFPHTFLDQDDLKRLVLYFPTIRVLQIVPDWDLNLPPELQESHFVEPFCPVLDSSFSEMVHRGLKTYLQLGQLHQDGGALEAMRAQVLQEDPEGARTYLLAHLKQSGVRLASEEEELVEAAVYLCLAHILDRERSELRARLAQFYQLEHSFHTALGAGEDEESRQDILEASLLHSGEKPGTEQPLQRLHAWSRLYLRRMPEQRPLLLTTRAEVLAEVNELCSRITSFPESQPSPSPLSSQFLAKLPDPCHLSLSQVVELREKWQAAGILATWHHALGQMLTWLEQTPPQHIAESPHNRELQQAIEPMYSSQMAAAATISLAAAVADNLDWRQMLHRLADSQFHTPHDIAGHSANCLSLLLAPDSDD
ncbi:MAG: hypothetical protein JRJ12_13790 [Deltaproteobacteria bacterium]|nr:hypothetical protein [Deltaproteobacteria bacterium]MBW2072490.1 hypothetical protein [Deltaproteobacteria bacterium]